MNGLESRPIQKVVVQAQGGGTFEFLVRATLLNTGNKAFTLVDRNGELRGATSKSGYNKSTDLVFFSSVLIDEKDVWTGDKKIFIGKLISLE